MELNELRMKIYEVDDRISELLVKRMQLSKEVAECKNRSGKKVFDKAREDEVLRHVAEKAGEEYGEYVRKIYNTVIETSREYQEKLYRG